MIRSFATKDPQEIDFWEIDFTTEMPTSDSIVSVITAFVTGPDTAFAIDNIGFAGKSVSGRWQGGTAESDYYVTARVTTAQGRTLDKTGHVLVTDT